MSIETLLIIESLIFGLIIGSFLNVCIVRLPQNASIGGRSVCPKCGNKVAWFDNIPVLSFIFLKAKCRHCKSKISFQYPIVEIITSIFSLITLLHVSFQIETYLIWFLFFVCPLIVISVIDINHRIIPDVISLPGILTGFCVVAYFKWPDLTEAFLFSFYGMLLGGGALLVLSQLYFWIRKREGLGGGDIKLCAMLGAFLGIKAMIFIFFISSVLAVFFAIIMMMIPSKHQQDGPLVLPYGPFLSAAALIFYFFGYPLTQFYTEAMGLMINPFFN